MTIRSALMDLLAPALELGFSEYLSADNTAAPGTLIHSTASGKTAVITDIFVYNAAGSAAIITFYDEDSNIKARFTVAATTTEIIRLASGLRFDDVDIYVRTDQATDADVTIAGIEN